MAKRTTKTPATADLPTNGTAKTRAAKIPPKTTTARTAAPRAPRATRTGEMDSPPKAHEVATRAYFRYLERGGSHGQSMEDWLAAEAELRAERAAWATKTASAKR